MQRPKCKRCQGTLIYKPADVSGPEHVKCLMCGWIILRGEMVPEIEETPEQKRRIASTKKQTQHPFETWTLSTGAKKWRGYCHVCDRQMVLLTSRYGECYRCYTRRTKGYDPLLTSSEVYRQARQA